MAKIKTVFRCEAAGRDNNEDNGKILQLGKHGTLLLVCDGMGGMQAGEVASALAVATIEQWFAPDQLSQQALADPQSYMKQAIVGADTNIKNYTKTHPETEGMGSTVVMTWLMGQKAYVAWCGDSRAYRYNPQLGLERLSHDHSLVQTWVDAGQITEDQAFDHPQSNIITRSLGDPNGTAHPDAAEFMLYNNDVLLLCSDGLCGTLRDQEIESIISQNADLAKCCDALWKADEAAGWHDNVTTALAQVEADGVVLSSAKVEAAPEMEIINEPKEEEQSLTRSKYLQYVGLGTLCVAVLFGAYYFLKPKKAGKEALKTEVKEDKPEEPVNTAVSFNKDESREEDDANLASDRDEEPSIDEEIKENLKMEMEENANKVPDAEASPDPEKTPGQEIAKPKV